VSERALQALEEVVARGGDADDVLRGIVRALVDESAIAWAGIAFLEQGELVLGPSAGQPDEASRVKVAVSFDGAPVGELWVDGDADRAFLEQAAALVSPYVLIGWDTRGEEWTP
jgi:hypothetical protein